MTKIKIEVEKKQFGILYNTKLLVLLALQSSTNAESLVERGIGNTSMNTIAGSPLEEDDNTSDTSDSSSSFQFVLTDEDVSTGNYFFMGGLTNLSALIGIIFLQSV